MHDLASLTTFGVPASARSLVPIATMDDLGLLGEDRGPVLLLGGGSNVLFTRPFDGTVVHMRATGRRVIAQDGEHAVVEAMAGEIWDEFVAWTVEEGLTGLENLSLIPGTVGAAPVQNLGAYGVELRDRFEALEAFDLRRGARRWMRPEDCAFGYRDSVFKHAGRDVLLVLRVRFRLDRRFTPVLGYAGVREQLANPEKPSAREVRDAVIAVRRAKLPDPAEIGNAGSFFKNPVVAPAVAEALRALLPDLVAHEVAGGVKLAAGQLIDRAGWKGHRDGAVGVHDRQALVLVNHGGAEGAAIAAMAARIQASVEERFGVALEPEVRIL